MRLVNMDMNPGIKVTFLVHTAILLKFAYGITSSQSVTLTDKATSYLAYEHWNSTNMVQISFLFKTYCSHCLLFYIDNTKGDQERENFLLLTLLKGELSVYVHRKSNLEILQKTFTLSKDLYDINWHKVDISLSDSGSFISVDNEKKTLVDNALMLSSPMYLGGIEEDENISTAADTTKISYIQRFVGCIGSVTILMKTGKRRRAVEMKRNKASSGCLDACRDDSCENSGRCLNWFTYTGCDCIGTGFQGPRCTTVTESVFLNNTEYLNVSLPQWQNPLIFRMRFRTSQAEGLLLGTKLRESGFYVAIVEGYIKVSIKTGKVFDFGNGMLHDNQWHFLTITITNAVVGLKLDRKFGKTWEINENRRILNFPIYIGSVPNDGEQVNSKMPNSFTGCFQQIYVQDINVIYKMLHTGDSRLSLSNKVVNGCPLKHENAEEARKRIMAEKRRRSSTISPNIVQRNNMVGKNVNKNRPTKGLKKEPKSHARLTAENNKDLIAWITSGVVSGTIVLMIMTACAIHYFKFKYENIFVTRMHEQESMQEQQQNISSIQMFPKQQAVVFLPEKQVTKVVNL